MLYCGQLTLVQGTIPILKSSFSNTFQHLLFDSGVQIGQKVSRKIVKMLDNDAERVKFAKNVLLKSTAQLHILERTINASICQLTSSVFEEQRMEIVADDFVIDDFDLQSLLQGLPIHNADSIQDLFFSYGTTVIALTIAHICQKTEFFTLSEKSVRYMFDLLDHITYHTESLNSAHKALIRVLSDQEELVQVVVDSIPGRPHLLQLAPVFCMCSEASQLHNLWLGAFLQLDTKTIQSQADNVLSAIVYADMYSEDILSIALGVSKTAKLFSKTIIVLCAHRGMDVGDFGKFFQKRLLKQLRTPAKQRDVLRCLCALLEQRNVSTLFQPLIRCEPSSLVTDEMLSEILDAMTGITDAWAARVLAGVYMYRLSVLSHVEETRLLKYDIVGVLFLYFAAMLDESVGTYISARMGLIQSVFERCIDKDFKLSPIPIFNAIWRATGDHLEIFNLFEEQREPSADADPLILFLRMSNQFPLSDWVDDALVMRVCLHNEFVWGAFDNAMEISNRFDICQYAATFFDKILSDDNCKALIPSALVVLRQLGVDGPYTTALERVNSAFVNGTDPINTAQDSEEVVFLYMRCLEACRMFNATLVVHHLQPTSVLFFGCVLDGLYDISVYQTVKNLSLEIKESMRSHMDQLNAVFRFLFWNDLMPMYELYNDFKHHFGFDSNHTAFFLQEIQDCIFAEPQPCHLEFLLYFDEEKIDLQTFEAIVACHVGSDTFVWESIFSALRNWVKTEPYFDVISSICDGFPLYCAQNYNHLESIELLPMLAKREQCCELLIRDCWFFRDLQEFVSQIMGALVILLNYQPPTALSLFERLASDYSFLADEVVRRVLPFVTSETVEYVAPFFKHASRVDFHVKWVLLYAAITPANAEFVSRTLKKTKDIELAYNIVRHVPSLLLNLRDPNDDFFLDVLDKILANCTSFNTDDLIDIFQSFGLEVLFTLYLKEARKDTFMRLSGFLIINSGDQSSVVQQLAEIESYDACFSVLLTLREQCDSETWTGYAIKLLDLINCVRPQSLHLFMEFVLRLECTPPVCQALLEAVKRIFVRKPTVVLYDLLLCFRDWDPYDVVSTVARAYVSNGTLRSALETETRLFYERMPKPAASDTLSDAFTAVMDDLDQFETGLGAASESPCITPISCRSEVSRCEELDSDICLYHFTNELNDYTQIRSIYIQLLKHHSSYIHRNLHRRVMDTVVVLLSDLLNGIRLTNLLDMALDEELERCFTHSDVNMKMHSLADWIVEHIDVKFVRLCIVVLSTGDEVVRGHLCKLLSYVFASPIAFEKVGVLQSFICTYPLNLDSDFYSELVNLIHVGVDEDEHIQIPNMLPKPFSPNAVALEAGLEAFSMHLTVDCEVEESEVDMDEFCDALEYVEDTQQ
ncbi:hypothetical protein PCE1_003504 [Barthelona sp. PCE]